MRIHNVFGTVSASKLQLTFKKLPLVEFSYCVKKEYPQLSEKTVKILLPFPTTYLYEAGFPPYTSTKTHVNRLNVEADVRIHLSPVKPDIKEICKNVNQCHCSY